MTIPNRYKSFLERTSKEMNLIHEAIIFAARKHAGQVRKGTDIPYITHPMEVMQILTNESCTEDVIIAGILHDTLEDTNTSSEEILNLFNENILKLVTAESEDKSKSWKERKQATIDSLTNSHNDIKMICLADKLSNLRSLSAEKEAWGEIAWTKFNAPRVEIEWYYRQVFMKVSDLWRTKMYQEYSTLLDEVF